MSDLNLAESYLPSLQITDLSDSQQQIQRLGLNKSLHLLILVAEKQKNPTEAYISLLRGLTELYYSLKPEQNWFGDSSWYPIVKELVLVCRQMDEDCGSDLQLIVRGLTSQEESDRLQRLDVDRLIFKRLLTNNLKNRCPVDYPAFREVFLYLVELIFVFNGYQAPHRTCPLKAAQDAVGQTDLFQELLEEIESEGISDDSTSGANDWL